jgi:hypothetical protein
MTSRAQSTAVFDRLAALRTLAADDPARAQSDTWAWIEELGEARDGKQLEQLFGLGSTPQA